MVDNHAKAADVLVQNRVLLDWSVYQFLYVDPELIFVFDLQTTHTGK